ncbi:transposase [Aeromonas salmonicida]
MVYTNSRTNRSRKGRANYSREFKQRLVDAANQLGVSVSKLAQKHGVNANLLFKWRRDAKAEAETREDAHKAFDPTLPRFQAKYPGAMDKLVKDRDELLAFYDFPAELWVSIRTTNPIESTFSTVRLRSKRARNCGSREIPLAMVYKAQKGWKRLKGFALLTLVVNNVKFQDGVQVEEASDRNAA